MRQCYSLAREKWRPLIEFFYVLIEKVISNRTEHIDQHTRLATDCAMIEVGFDVEAVAWPESRRGTVDSDIEFTALNVGDLRVRMRVNLANRASVEFDFGHQDGIVVPEDLASKAVTNGLSGRPGAEHYCFTLSLHVATPHDLTPVTAPPVK